MPHRECIGNEYKEDFDTLQELVDKATPKLPKRNLGKGTYYKCPVCDSPVGTKSKYCRQCGQSIKWERLRLE
jgi:RNA polymerase-binding transcription factor DksA